MEQIYIVLNMEGEPVLAFYDKTKAQAVADSSSGLSGIVGSAALIGEDDGRERMSD